LWFSKWLRWFRIPSSSFNHNDEETVGRNLNTSGTTICTILKEEWEKYLDIENF
jgi:hypothetical protein